MSRVCSMQTEIAEVDTGNEVETDPSSRWQNLNRKNCWAVIYIILGQVHLAQALNLKKQILRQLRHLILIKTTEKPSKYNHIV